MKILSLHFLFALSLIWASFFNFYLGYQILVKKRVLLFKGGPIFFNWLPILIFGFLIRIAGSFNKDGSTDYSMLVLFSIFILFVIYSLLSRFFKGHKTYFVVGVQKNIFEESLMNIFKKNNIEFIPKGSDHKLKTVLSLPSFNSVAEISGSPNYALSFLKLESSVDKLAFQKMKRDLAEDVNKQYSKQTKTFGIHIVVVGIVFLLGAIFSAWYLVMKL